MRVFLIHRSADKASACRLLKTVAKERQIALSPFVMDSSSCYKWKEVARTEIARSEAVVVINEKACLESENATWEIEVSNELNKPLFILDPSNPDTKVLDALCSVYNHDQEFEFYFKKKTGYFFSKKKGDEAERDKETIELYKVMVASSEQLIQRRQTMNAFFIAAIGSLLAFAGALVKLGNVDSKFLSLLVILLLTIVGLILCYSWHNLIDNYGKLNRAKFRVITKLEESLPTQIFSAEWAALGKGSRPDKYKSFTSTEKNVPKGFAALIFVLFVLSLGWYLCPLSGFGKHELNPVSPASATVNMSNDVLPLKSEKSIKGTGRMPATSP